MTNDVLTRANELKEAIDYNKSQLRQVDMVRNSIKAFPHKVIMTLQSFESEEAPSYAYNISLSSAAAMDLLNGLEATHREKLNTLESALAAL